MISDLELTKEEILELVKGLPRIYSETAGSDTRIYQVNASINPTKFHGVLMFIPYKNSVGVATDVAPTFLKFNNNITVPLYTIASNGVLRNICKGDIIPNRLCMVRMYYDKSKAILINSTLQDDALVGSLTVLNNTVFGQIPSVTVSEEGIDKQYALVSIKDFVSLEDRVAHLENMIQIGTEDPLIAMNGLDEGQIYIKLDELNVIE